LLCSFTVTGSLSEFREAADHGIVAAALHSAAEEKLCPGTVPRDLP
jgi:hypothetical protein